jgi:hypothetical protein
MPLSPPLDPGALKRQRTFSYERTLYEC